MRRSPLAFLCLILFCIVTGAIAQSLPAGYAVQDGISGKNQVFADLDGDGNRDILAVVENNGQTMVYASLQEGKLILKSKDAPRCCNQIELAKNVIVLHSNGMRGFYIWRFRYNPSLHNFQLIGMDTESFGNAVHDASGTSSFNLITGDFEAKYNSWNEKQKKLIALTPVKKKLKPGREILLTDFGDESDDYVLGLMQKFLPKEVR